MPDSPFYRTSPALPAAPPSRTHPSQGQTAGKRPTDNRGTDSKQATAKPPAARQPGIGGNAAPTPRSALLPSVGTAQSSIEALRRKALGAPSSVPSTSPPTPRSRTKANPKVVARRETRAQLVERLNNPLLTLQEASLLLNVCPATVRRWANAGQLPHVRTEGNQRRFRWRDVQPLMPESVARRRA